MSHSANPGVTRELSSRDAPTPRDGGPSHHVVTRATLAVALVAGLIAGFSGLLSSPAAAERKLQGTLTFTSQLGSGLGEPCASGSAYPDVRDGVAITVRDVTGKSVGVGHLSEGKATGASCVRSLDIDSVPVLPEYQLIIGTSGPFVVTAEALEASGNLIDLRFGA